MKDKKNYNTTNRSNKFKIVYYPEYRLLCDLNFSKNSRKLHGDYSGISQLLVNNNSGNEITTLC